MTHSRKIIAVLLLVVGATVLVGLLVVRARPTNCDHTNAQACTVQKYGRVDPIECDRFRRCNEATAVPGAFD